MSFYRRSFLGIFPETDRKIYSACETDARSVFDFLDCENNVGKCNYTVSIVEWVLESDDFSGSSTEQSEQ